MFQDGSVQLSSVGEPGTQSTSVCLSSSRLTFTVRFLARIGQTAISQAATSAQISAGEVSYASAISVLFLLIL